MEYRQGHIYLADLNPTKHKEEPAKVRPVLVIQNDVLNEVGHPSTVIIPLTTNIKSGFKLLRLRVTKRDKLERDSDILIDQIRSIDNKRFMSDSICFLKDKELESVLDLICNIMKRI
jgi:mRNA interferase MazF